MQPPEPHAAADADWSARILSRARKLWNAKRRAEALAQIESALARRPGDGSLILRRGAFLRRMGRAREAVATLQPLWRASPQDAVVMLELAEAHRAMGDHAAALPLLDALLQAAPSQHGALVLRIDTLIALNRPDAALAATEATLADLPQERRLWQRRGRLLRDLGRAREAVDMLSPLHRRWPDDADIAMELALALGAAGDHAASMAMVDAVLAINPTCRPAWNARIDAAAARADQAALREMARGFSERLAAEGSSNAAVLLAQVLPKLDLQSWGAELAGGINAIRPHAARLKPAQLWSLHGMALLLGEGESCRHLLACLLARPSLPLSVATGMMRWAGAVSRDHHDRMVPELRGRLSAQALRLFDLERIALELGPAQAVSGRQRSGERPAEEVILLLSLMQKAGLLPQALRYATLARRFHPGNPELRRSRLALLNAAGETGQALLEAEAMLAPSAGANVQNPRAAIGTLIALGHAARALELLDAVETPENRPSFRNLRLELMLRLGRFDVARALASELTTLAHARRAMHFSLTLEGQQLIELGIMEASKAAGGPLPREGQLLGPSVRALDLHLPRLPPPRSEGPGRIPRRIMQYWNTGRPPAELDAIMASWREAEGFGYQLFDRPAALRFLAEDFGADWAAALRLANHPAEESDFFRLAFLAARGGIYADCDDRLVGPAGGLVAGACGLVLYRERRGTIANNLILAEAAHPVLVRAAVAAKQALLRKDNDSAWTKTGPGLLTRIVAVALGEAAAGNAHAGITVRRIQEAAPYVRCHIDVPYKRTPRYWNAGHSGGHRVTTPPSLP